MNNEFEKLNLSNSLIDINKIEKKVQYKIKLLCIPGIAGMAIAFVGPLCILASQIISGVYVLPTILLGLSPIITLAIYENRLVTYLRSKYGRTYRQNNLIVILQQVDNQKLMISYFNEMVQKHNSLINLVNNLKTAFAQNDYDSVVEQLPQLLNDINYYENKLALEKQKEIERQDFEKKIGIQSNNKNEEIEIEYSSQLKQYL